MQTEIFIEDLKCVGSHGVSKKEREESREFFIDVKIILLNNSACETDLLEDTIDYSTVRELVCNIVRKESMRLLESLAYKIAKEIIKFLLVKNVTITIKKPGIWEVGTPGVSVKLEKS